MAYGPSKDVHFRIAQAAYEAESAAAQAVGQSLAMRLRGVVERDAAMVAELQAIRADLAEIAAGLGQSSAPDAQAGMLAEVLMLLRVIAGPEKVRMVQADVVRVGLKVWEAK